MKGRNEKPCKTLDTVDQSDIKISQILALIDSLHKFRLIEKIARPVPYAQKEKWFLSFKQKFIQLHTHLQQMRRDSPKDHQTSAEKLNTNNSTKGERQIFRKEDIRKISSAYTQVLIEGSFKFFIMVAKVAGLPVNLDLINIHEWAVECMDQQNQKKCCGKC